MEIEIENCVSTGDYPILVGDLNAKMENNIDGTVIHSLQMAKDW